MNYSKVSNIEKEIWIKLYNEGNSLRDIHLLLNKSISTIWRHIKDSVIIKDQYFYNERMTNYIIDNNIFENINTKNKSYILGFLLADGHRLKNSNQIRLKLQERDINILEKINKELNYIKPLIFDKKREEKNQNQYSLIICNKKICEDLENYGIVKNKTFNITIPIIDDKLFIDLFRGYFDGDGWFTCNKENKAGEIGIIGEYEFISFIKEKIKELYNIDSRFSKDKRVDSRIINLRIRKRLDINKLYDLMYFDTDLYLERKYLKIQKYLIDNNLIK